MDGQWRRLERLEQDLKLPRANLISNLVRQEAGNSVPFNRRSPSRSDAVHAKARPKPDPPPAGKAPAILLAGLGKPDNGMAGEIGRFAERRSPGEIIRRRADGSPDGSDADSQLWPKPG